MENNRWISPTEGKGLQGLAIVFGGASGIIFTDYLKQGKIVNGKYEEFLDRLKSAHLLIVASTHRHYSPDLAPSDYVLFSLAAKNWLTAPTFKSNKELSN